ncbi:hypothetical protein ABK040_010499 [Willaertia magna]
MLSSGILEEKKEFGVSNNIFNKQLLMFNENDLKTLQSTSILIVGLSGLGIEIVKNLILIGAKNLTLFDNENLSSFDLSSHYFCNEENIGQNRAKISLQKLNEFYNEKEMFLKILECNELTENLLLKFQIIIFTNSHIPNLVELNNICRKNNIKFIAGENRGLVGSVFCDFGCQPFIVKEDSGELTTEKKNTSAVINITNEVEATVKLDDYHGHKFQEGDYVIFDKIEGMNEINNLQYPIKINYILGRYSFKINLDTTNFKKFKENSLGYVRQVKMPMSHSFKSLNEELKNPTITTTRIGEDQCEDQQQLKQQQLFVVNSSKINRQQQLHVAMLALTEFEKRNLTLPKPFNKQDVKEMIGIAKQIVKELKPQLLLDNNNEEEKENVYFNEKVIELLSFTCRGNLSPMASFLGGIISQEVIKACIGKYTPLKQFLYFDAFDCLPEEECNFPTEEECQLVSLENNDDKNECSKRFDGQVVVFGKKFQKKLEKEKQCIVGLGSIGCEILKNYAMIGVGFNNNNNSSDSGDSNNRGDCNNGSITIIDYKNIKPSNLNTQFLYSTNNRNNIGKEKVTVASKIIKTMLNNNNNNIIPYHEKITDDSKVFHDEFWENLTGITLAVDDIKTRCHIDGICVFHKKPLIETGANGNKGNVQVVIPPLTESFGKIDDLNEEMFSISYIRNSPHLPEQCMLWGEDLLTRYFKEEPIEMNSFLKDKEAVLVELDQSTGFSKYLKSKQIVESLILKKPNDFDDCVVWARNLFEQLFNNNIQQLLHNFPLDMLTTSGLPFWGGSRRIPTPLIFNVKNPKHVDFVIATANLRAKNYGIKGYNKDEYDFVKVLEKIIVPEFHPITHSNDDNTNEEEENYRNHLKMIDTQLKVDDNYFLKPINVENEMEEDNYCLDFVEICCNLRANVYSIPESNRNEIVMTALKIIPRTITTASILSGLATFELYKIVQQSKKISTYNSSYINTSLPFISLFEPKEATIVTRLRDQPFTIYDMFYIDEGRDITLKEFMDIFKERYGLEITMMSCGTNMLYSFFGAKKKMEERLKSKMIQLAKSFDSLAISSYQKYLKIEFCCDDLMSGEDVDVPGAKYRLYH